MVAMIHSSCKYSVAFILCLWIFAATNVIFAATNVSGSEPGYDLMSVEHNTVLCIPPAQSGGGGGGGGLVFHKMNDHLYYDENGDPQTTDQPYSNYQVDITDNGNGNYTWRVDASVNPNWPHFDGQPLDPNLPYVLDLVSGQAINLTNTGGATVRGSGTSVQLSWSAAPQIFTLSGTVDASSATYLNINSDASGCLQMTFSPPGTDPCAGGPGPVCCPGPPTAPRPPCAEEGSQADGAASGHSAFSPMSSLLSYGSRTDYNGMPKVAAGCSSCSGGTGGLPRQTTKPAINISRVVVPPEVSHHSSFGLGWFSQTDFSVDFFVGDDEIHRLILFDPITEKVIEMVDSGDSEPEGMFFPDSEHQQYFTKLVLVNGTNAMTIPSVHFDENPGDITAILTRRNGWKYEFQLVDIHPLVNPDGNNPIDPAARLQKIISPDGFSIDIEYNGPDEFPDDEISLDPLRQFQVKTISDGYGNQADYTFDPLQFGGRWVTTQIDINGGLSGGGESLQYQYDPGTGRLDSVTRNNVTIASYQYTEYSPWGADTIVAEEISPGGPKTTDTIYISQDTMIFDGQLINQFSARLLGRADGDSVFYLRVNRRQNDPPDGDVDQMYRVEYRGRLFDWSFGTFLKYYTSYKVDPLGKGFESYINLVEEATFPKHESPSPDNDPPTLAQVLRGEPEHSVDPTGYGTRPFNMMPTAMLPSLHTQMAVSRSLFTTRQTI